MSKLIEVSEFSESVLRIDVNTLVKGFDGNELGPANEQAQALANRTLYLKEKLEEVVTQLSTLGKEEYVASINEQSGVVTISYIDIGAAAEKHTHLVADITPTDEKGFVSSDEKTRWDGKQEQLVSGKNISTLHNKSLLGDGDVQLSYSDVGAEKAGTADSKVADHLASQDPHSQYLTESRGSNVFILKSDGNKPNGYLKLDDKGYIPSDISTLYEARYRIVDNKEERLKIEQSKNLTMALQLDENNIYYLDSDADPSIEGNWKEGRSTELSDVISVFNRSGIITAENGDYNADQITETDDRVFVSPSDKQSWNDKQTQLVSGKNIKTVNGEAILGEGDFQLTPESINAADKIHKHDPADIKTDSNNQFVSEKEKATYSAKQDKLVSGTNLSTVFGQDLLAATDITLNDVDNLAEVINNVITPGSGIKIALDREKNTLTVSKTSDNSSISLVVKEIDNAEADASYYFPADKDNYAFLAYALKQVNADAEKIVIDYTADNTDIQQGELPDLLTTESNYVFNMVGYNDYDYGTRGISKPTGDVNSVDIVTTEGSYLSVPVLVKESSLDGIVTSIGSTNVSSCFPWKAFSKAFTESEQKNVPNYNYFCDNQYRNNLKNEIYIGFTSTVSVAITEYRIQRVTKFATGTTTTPTAWNLQARNTDSESWKTIESRSGQNITGGTDWLIYTLAQPANYKQFRLLITAAASSGAVRTGITKLRFYSKSKSAILGKDGEYYIPDSDGGLTKIADKEAFHFDQNGFTNTPVPLLLSKINNLMPFTVISMAGGNVKLTYKKIIPFITLHSPVKRYKDWEEIDQLKISEFYKDQDKTTMRFAVTTGNGNYYIFNRTAWERIGNLNTNDISATFLYNKGMSAATLEAITGAQWAILATLESADVEIGLAYANMVNNNEDSKTPKTVQFIFNATTKWKKLGTEEVAIGVSGSKISFIPKTAGSYKFCYQFF